ncbi:MAG: MurR/RpiR family transcriptional regulator, partial [Candidatus Nanopelagicales bacterium]
ADISYKFNRLGHGCVHWSDHHAALTSISTLSKGDVLFLISHSGNTPETIAVATEFKNRGVSIAVITNSPRSGLAQLADFLFLTQAERNVVRVGATVSRIAQLLIVDCIAIAAARRSWEISRAALTDASAAIERQINYKDWLYEGSIASATDSLGG